MKSWLKWRSDRVALLLILFLFLSHLPFLTSDPDAAISFSRGPFTDEGLNTIQVRNLINHGYLSLEECDNLLKTPLFGIMVGIPMFIFGTDLLTSRLTVLVLSFLVLLFLARERLFSPILLLLAPVTMFKYQVFQFSHFSLAEIPAVMSIVLGIYFVHLSYKPFRSEKEYIKNALLAGTFLSLAWYFKIQFIYIIALGPLIAIERALFARNLGRKIRWLNGMVLAGTSLFFLLLYLFAWYLPFSETYDHMMSHQSGTFSLSHKTWEYTWFNISYFMLSYENLPISILFMLCLVAGIILLSRKPSPHYPLLFKATLLWWVLELHKVTMVYLPTRYQVSLFTAMGLLIAIVLAEIFLSAAKSGTYLVRVILRTGAVTFVLLLFVFNFIDYHSTLRNRTHNLREANQYLANTLDEDDMALGAWAPSLTWGSRSRAVPVWGGFLNDEEPLRRHQPKVVISEPDEQDSEQAYSKQGIDLAQRSDSVSTFQIGIWKVNVYWIK